LHDDGAITRHDRVRARRQEHQEGEGARDPEAGAWWCGTGREHLAEG